MIRKQVVFRKNMTKNSHICLISSCLPYTRLKLDHSSQAQDETKHIICLCIWAWVIGECRVISEKWSGFEILAHVCWLPVLSIKLFWFTENVLLWQRKKLWNFRRWHLTFATFIKLPFLLTSIAAVLRKSFLWASILISTETNDSVRKKRLF